MVWIILGWAIGEAVWVRFGFGAIDWAIGGAISGAIGGFVLIWQIRSIENVTHEKAEYKAAGKTTDFTKSNYTKSITDNKKFLLSPIGRMIMGGLVGLILWVMITDWYGFGFMPTLLVACGLSGLITYPHKLSIVFLIIGFLVAGSIGYFDYYDTPDFVAYGGVFGIPAGALLSRILHWIKVLK